MSENQLRQFISEVDRRFMAGSRGEVDLKALRNSMGLPEFREYISACRLLRHINREKRK